MTATMTIREIAELAGVSRDSVERTVRELYPTLMERGKTTELDHTAKSRTSSGAKSTATTEARRG